MKSVLFVNIVYSIEFKGVGTCVIWGGDFVHGIYWMGWDQRASDEEAT